MSNKVKGNICLLVTAILWGTGFIAQKLGMGIMSPLLFNGIRLILASLVLLPLMMKEINSAEMFSHERFSEEAIAAKKGNIIKGSLICGLFLAAGGNLQQTGLVTVDVGKSAFISVLYVVIVPILSLFAGKKIEKKIWLSVALAIAGLAMLCLKHSSGGITVGDMVTLASALFFALQIVAVNHYITVTNAIVLSVAQMIVSGAVSIVLSFILEDPSIAQITACALPLCYSALIPTAIGYTLQIIGQKYTSATIASLLMSLEAVFSAILGAVFLHESMTAQEWTGCAVIFAAIVLAQVQLPAADNNGKR